MKKEIQDEIDALRAEIAVANVATEALKREKELYRQQANETEAELAKVRLEILRAESEKAQLLRTYNALKNSSKL